MLSQIEFDWNFFVLRKKLVGMNEKKWNRNAFCSNFEWRETTSFSGAKKYWHLLLQNRAQWSNLRRQFLNAKIHSTELHNISFLWQFTSVFFSSSVLARAYPFFVACAKTRKIKTDNSDTNKSSKKMRMKWTRARSSEPHFIVYVVPFSVICERIYLVLTFEHAFSWRSSFMDPTREWLLKLLVNKEWKCE